MTKLTAFFAILRTRLKNAFCSPPPPRGLAGLLVTSFQLLARSTLRVCCWP